MNQTILIILIFILALTLGIYLGRLLSNLKNKGAQYVLQEQSAQLKLQVEDRKGQLNSQLDNFKSEIRTVKSEAAAQLQKTENERDSIRKEKDFLSDELTRRNSEFENLQQRNRNKKRK